MATPHRYWRIFIDGTINGGNDYINLREIELIGLDAVTDLTTPTTPMTASSQFNSTTGPDKAVDDNMGTLWHTVQATTHWIAADLGSPFVVRGVTITDGGNVLGRVPKNFRVQFSDNGTAWVDLYTAPTQPPWASLEKRSFIILPGHVSGTAKLDTGAAASYVLVRDWSTHGHLAAVIPDVAGAWSADVLSAACDVTIIGPSGYQPVTHGPITPIIT